MIGDLVMGRELPYDRRTLSRTGVLLTAAGLFCAAGTWPQVPDALRAIVASDFPTAIEQSVVIVLAACSAWVLAVVMAEWRHLRLPGVPHALRAALFTGTVLIAAAQPAHADDAIHDLNGLPLPDRPTVSDVTSTTTAERPPDTVTVRSGDTLWHLAADGLPADATAAEIAEASRGWYSSNRSVIGDDPDLLLPGQVLTVPGADR